MNSTKGLLNFLMESLDVRCTLKIGGEFEVWNHTTINKIFTFRLNSLRFSLLSANLWRCYQSYFWRTLGDGPGWTVVCTCCWEGESLPHQRYNDFKYSQIFKTFLFYFLYIPSEELLFQSPPLSFRMKIIEQVMYP